MRGLPGVIVVIALLVSCSDPSSEQIVKDAAEARVWQAKMLELGISSQYERNETGYNKLRFALTEREIDNRARKQYEEYLQQHLRLTDDKTDPPPTPDQFRYLLIMHQSALESLERARANNNATKREPAGNRERKGSGTRGSEP